jgi:DNA gyrase inhibitor GyrI
VETGVIPGGWYARSKLMDWEKSLSELAGLFEEMARANDVDPERPSLEFYRSHVELQLYLPVRSHSPI